MATVKPSEINYEFKFNATELEGVLARLQTAIAEKTGAENQAVLRRAVKAGLELVGVQIEEWVREYPPAPPGSTYRRTGKYGRRWNYKVSSQPSAGRYWVTIGNPLDYAPYVGGAYPGVEGTPHQTEKHHQTGWVSLPNQVATNLDQLVGTLEGAAFNQLDDLLGSL